MARRSQLELRSVWEALLATDAIDAATRAEVEEAFSAADRLPMAIKVNKSQVSARDIYFAYGEGEFFATDDEARRLLSELSVGPMQDLVPMLFHGVCSTYRGLVFLVLDVILEHERLHPSSAPATPAEPTASAGPATTRSRYSTRRCSISSQSRFSAPSTGR